MRRVIKPFLVLRLRPETETSDGEFEAFLERGGLGRNETHRIRLDQEPIPAGLDIRDYAGIIVGGGPGCVSDSDDRKSPVERRIGEAVFGLMPAVTETDFPFLGCCYGIGILAAQLGGRVGNKRYGKEVGAVECPKTP